jgi:hypothetical protein
MCFMCSFAGNNVSFNLHLAKSSDRGPETSVMLLCIFPKFRPLLGMAVRLIPYMETSGRNRSNYVYTFPYCT